MGLRGRAVHVVVPAHDEARWIGEVLATMPAFVDRVVVVDDGSDDGTAAAAERAGDPRLDLVSHARPRGVGAAIAAGYRRALALGADVAAVMAGDAQMDPADLERVVAPVVRGEADYVKGNRLVHRDAAHMPHLRAVGTRVFGRLTALATGVALGDSQCGYTAISRRALLRIDLDGLWPSYGYPNDLLGAIAREGLSIVEVPVRPVYRGQASGLRPYHAAVILGLLARVALRRVLA
jgi:glycosyltransferase involved in cell wall biosynthesis